MELFVFGTQGRMATAIKELALMRADIQLLEQPKKNCALIDFTAPSALEKNLKVALDHGSPLMVGTTGLTEAQHQSLVGASIKIPVLWASNTSLGANLLFELASLSAKVLADFQVSIKDVHHVHKKDAPSGTALTLKKSVRRPVEIQSIRDGECAGIHEVRFESPYETILLKHEVSDRRVFAEGALLAATFLSQQNPGLYTMKDVLGLS